MLTIQQLNNLGMEVRPDPDQPGRFFWVHDQEGSEVSFETEALAQANASAYATDRFTLSVCQNCEKMHSDETLEEIENFHERVAPGEIVPSGQCPDCGAVCHHYSETPCTPPDEAGDFETTMGAIEGYLSSKADHGDALAAKLVALLKPWLQIRYGAMSLTDMGVTINEFESEADRIRHFAGQSSIEDDHYFIDVRGVIVDAGLATVGSDAMEDLRCGYCTSQPVGRTDGHNAR
jgi:hypothetical protein